MLFETAQEYFKLERMEFASLKKKTLCEHIHKKFVKIYNEFAELEYDILIPEEIRFTDHVISFLAKVTTIIAHYDISYALYMITHTAFHIT